MGQKIKIVSSGTTAHVYVDGEDVAKYLIGYEVRHEAGGRCVVDLHYLPDEVEIDVAEVNCDGDTERCL